MRGIAIRISNTSFTLHSTWRLGLHSKMCLRTSPHSRVYHSWLVPAIYAYSSAATCHFYPIFTVLRHLHGREFRLYAVLILGLCTATLSYICLASFAYSALLVFPHLVNRRLLFIKLFLDFWRFYSMHRVPDVISNFRSLFTGCHITS